MKARVPPTTAPVDSCPSPWFLMSPLESWTCPVPLRHAPTVTLAHGGGGQLTADLVEHLFAPAFGNDPFPDAAEFTSPGGRLAMATDSFVVRPLFFPGGCIGDLAVNGTVNDLAMCGAVPTHLTAAFILEEGLPVATLAGIVQRMADAARAAGIRIVAGDTKVVERNRGDGCFITTAGVGVLPGDLRLGAEHIRPGDAVLLSGTIADHGMAVMSVREGLGFEAEIHSDTAPLHRLVRVLLDETAEIRCFRDPTRGGVAATLNEFALQARLGITIEERRIPVRDAVRSACEMLGFDPLTVANEGKLVALVPAERADAVLDRMRREPEGADAAVIGHVTAEHPGRVVVRTAIGGSRILAMPLGELLPRIC